MKQTKLPQNKPNQTYKHTKLKTNKTPPKQNPTKQTKPQHQQNPPKPKYPHFYILRHWHPSLSDVFQKYFHLSWQSVCLCDGTRH